MIVKEIISLKDFLQEENSPFSNLSTPELKQKFAVLENLYFKHHQGKFLLSYCTLLAITMEYIEIDDFERF